MKSTILFSLTLSALYVGCAHQKSAPLPGEWKVGEGRLSTGMPNYPLSTEAFETAQKNQVTRAPAAVSDEELARQIEEQEQKPSLRRLYFRALYQQWRELAHISGGASLRSCPQYHHDKTVMDEIPVGLKPHIVGVKPAAGNLPYYPEWALSVKTDSGVKPAWHAGGQVKEALHGHGLKLRRELLAMCEEGASDAYFRLENIVTYSMGKAEYQRAEGMQALLKIPVFSTMLLMKAVQGGAQAQFNTYDQELLAEVNGSQLQRYIVELKSRRQQLLTGSL